MAIVSYDHTALPVGDGPGMLAFYRALGCEVSEDYQREGVTLLASVYFGSNKINLHMPGFWDGPSFPKGKDGEPLRGPTAQPGCGDLCFVWDGTVEEARALIEAAGGPLTEGPVPRSGRQDGVAAMGQSLYTRDPDGNLVELIVYGA